MGVGVFAYMIAVAQRTSFGVASTQAADRFGAAASELSLFTMLQVLIYAGMQIPVGVLVDRLGSRRMVAIGAGLMIVGQLILAVAESISVGVLARVFVGAGDAMTFVCVLKIVPAWFSLRYSPMVTMAVGAVGNLGQLLSVVPFSLLLSAAGWVPSFLSMAGLSVLTLVLVLAFLRDERPPLTHVCLTGRNASPALIEAADLVTEMTLVKHPFRDGVKAQPGVEF